MDTDKWGGYTIPDLQEREEKRGEEKRGEESKGDASMNHGATKMTETCQWIVFLYLSSFGL